MCPLCGRQSKEKEKWSGLSNKAWSLPSSQSPRRHPPSALRWGCRPGRRQGTAVKEAPQEETESEERRLPTELAILGFLPHGVEGALC